MEDGYVYNRHLLAAPDSSVLGKVEAEAQMNFYTARLWSGVRRLVRGRVPQRHF